MPSGRVTIEEDIVTMVTIIKWPWCGNSYHSYDNKMTMVWAIVTMVTTEKS